MRQEKTFSLICSTIGLIIACLIFFFAIKVFFVLFAAILLAIFLHGLSHWINKEQKYPYILVWGTLVVGLITFLSIVIWGATPLIGKQLSQLIEQLPSAYKILEKQLSSHIQLKFLIDKNFLNDLLLKNSSFLFQAAELFSFTVGTIVSFFIFIFIGLYISFNPKLYINGFLIFIPSEKRDRVANLLSKLHVVLQWWIIGKFIAMGAIGILTTIGLWLLDVPLAFILGLLAAILTFIPYIGAIIAAIPAILIALAVSPLMGLYVILLYLLIHALEGYCITPIIEQKTILLPPALTVTVQIILALLVGFLGLALASPVTAVLVVLMKELYVERHKNFSKEI